MRTRHVALGVASLLASLLAVSQAFADYSFSFTSRARHDGVGASAGESGGFSFGGAASGSAGGDAAQAVRDRSPPTTGSARTRRSRARR